MTTREELDDLLAASKAKFDAMSPEECEEMIRMQAQSWVRAEMGRPKTRCDLINGVKTYESYEDYCND